MNVAILAGVKAVVPGLLAAWGSNFVKTKGPSMIMDGTVAACAFKGQEIFSKFYLPRAGGWVGTAIGYGIGPFVAQSTASLAAVQIAAAAVPVGINLIGKYAQSQLSPPKPVEVEEKSAEAKKTSSVESQTE